MKLIHGGLHCQTAFNSLKIIAAPKEAPPFTADAIVFEEDTFLVLSADNTIRESGEHIVRIMTKIIETLPIPPGQVVKKGRKPLHLLAIVHDFDCEPSWREEWITRALDEIFVEIETRRLRTAAMPLIGTAFGSLKNQRFIYLLKKTMARMTFTHLKRLWLITPVGSNRSIIDAFDNLAE